MKYTHETNILFKGASYQYGVDDEERLVHFHFGKKTKKLHEETNIHEDRGFSGQPYHKRLDRTYSLDTMYQEYSSYGVGDFRPESLRVKNADGSKAFNPVFVEEKTLDAAEAAKAIEEQFGPAFPHFKNPDQRLDIVLEDKDSRIKVTLHYDFFFAFDAIQRSVTIVNCSNEIVSVEKISSFTLDIPRGKELDLIHFHGAHASERLFERIAAPYSDVVLSSVRGMSSHHENPTLILCDKGADEDNGECYLFSMVYSGDYFLECYREPQGGYRVNGGLNPKTFSMTLRPGESFSTPAAIMAYNEKGFANLSLKLHDLLKQHLLPSLPEKRPVLLNSWEGAMMDFDEKRILSMAKGAKEMGCDLFVLDDGWFIGRSDDKGGLGDWIPDTTKLGGSFDQLEEKIKKEGLSFGIWVEPEMVSEDSKIVKEHPEFLLHIPGRQPTISRGQFVLDMTNPAVQDYLFDRISAVLRDSHVIYLKWDFNRAVCDLYSSDSETLRRFSYRFMEGSYKLFYRIRTAFPDVLLENCAGGGGRFDLGMLYFSPQIWCSDNTDFADRSKIQYGTSFLYPPSAMGAHISKSPNPGTKRPSHLEQRFEVALMGSYGYELDPADVSAKEKKECARLSDRFRSLDAFVRKALFYRLSNPFEDTVFAYEFLSRNRKQCFVSVTLLGKDRTGVVRPKNLKADKRYEALGEIRTGAEWMKDGIAVEKVVGKKFAGDVTFLQK